MRVIFIVGAISWTVAIAIGSTMPAKQASAISPFKFEGADKVIHIVAYMVLMFLWTLVFKAKRDWIVIVFVCCMLFGLGLEICQSVFFETRSFEIMDIIANIMGTILGLVLFNKFSKNQTYVK